MIGTKVKFNKKAVAKQMYNNIAKEQTNRLIAYAEGEIIELVKTHEFQNRTRNIEDSYVWAVYYNGKREKYGFYGNKTARSKSVLHEYSPSISVDVNGRQLARKFIQSYKPDETQGWEIVFAACAPYGAYLEGGFTFKGRYYQFDVMSQRYDLIKRALTPLCRVRFEVNQPLY